MNTSESAEALTFESITLNDFYLNTVVIYLTLFILLKRDREDKIHGQHNCWLKIKYFGKMLKIKQRKKNN